MDIHKPKPIRNWREFLKEYAIIVIGVLTALAAEQAMEWAHWRGEVSIARQAIAAEIAANNSSFFARRIAFAPCIDRQISEAQAMIADIEAKRKPRPFTSFHIGSGALLNDSEWQSERASQVLTHFSRSELAPLSQYYARLQSMENFRVAEWAAWRELSLLRSPSAELGPDALNRLRVNLITAQQTEYLIFLYSTVQLRNSKRLGVTTPPVDPILVKNFCSMDEEHYQVFLKGRL